MLKLKLTKEEHAKLPVTIQAEYKEEGEGFLLETDVPFEDVTSLKSALKVEKEHRKKATEKVTELETNVTELTAEKDKLEARAKPAGDLEKSWQAKLDKVTNDFKQRENGLTGQLKTLLVDSVAQALAGEISTSPELMVPHILGRLSIEEVDGKTITRVLDEDGKPSALSVNELKQELVANKKFAPIVKASSASGGGASGSKGSVGGKSFKEMNEQEKVHLFKTNRAEFDRLSTEKQ